MFALPESHRAAVAAVHVSVFFRVHSSFSVGAYPVRFAGISLPAGRLRVLEPAERAVSAMGSDHLFRNELHRQYPGGAVLSADLAHVSVQLGTRAALVSIHAGCAAAA